MNFSSMRAMSRARIEVRERHAARHAAVAARERLANWLALLTLLALGIVWK